MSIFYAHLLPCILKIKRLSNPYWIAQTCLCNLFLVEQGGGSLSFIAYISFSMTKNNETVSNANNSNITDTSTHETGEILSLKQQLESYKRLFEIEKCCKNQVYSFILTCGHFNEYQEYFKTHPVEVDYHSACVDFIRLEQLKDKSDE